MSTARHHAEWLSLLEISGPFLSMPVLLRVFPQGLGAHDPDVLRELRTAYEEWLDNQQGLRPDRAIHHAWIRHVLERTLELPAKNIAEGQAIPASLAVPVPEHGETLRPDLVIMDADKPRMLIQFFPPNQDLDHRSQVKARLWLLQPASHVGCVSRLPDRVRVQPNRGRDHGHFLDGMPG